MLVLNYSKIGMNNAVKNPVQRSKMGWISIKAPPFLGCRHGAATSCSMGSLQGASPSSLANFCTAGVDPARRGMHSESSAGATQHGIYGFYMAQKPMGEILLFKAWGCLGRYVFRCFCWGDCYYSKVLMCWKSPKSLQIMGQSAAKLRPLGSPKHHRNRRPNPGHHGPTEWPDCWIFQGKLGWKMMNIHRKSIKSMVFGVFFLAIKPLGFVSWALLNPSLV
jgi:hypothetical protein